MSQDTDTDQDTDNLAGLREAARLGKEAIEQAALMTRENLFLRAGVDLDSKVGKMLFQQWEGDDLEALKAEAAELGVLVGPKAAFNPDEATQQQYRQTLNGPPPAMTDQQTPDPVQTAISQFHVDRKSGMPVDNARYAAFDRVVSAAANGDKRAIFDPVAYANQAAQYGNGRANA